MLKTKGIKKKKKRWKIPVWKCENMMWQKKKVKTEDVEERKEEENAL